MFPNSTVYFWYLFFKIMFSFFGRQNLQNLYWLFQYNLRPHLQIFIVIQETAIICNGRSTQLNKNSSKNICYISVRNIFCLRSSKLCISLWAWYKTLIFKEVLFPPRKKRHLLKEEIWKMLFLKLSASSNYRLLSSP